jgi:hypothetical protein
VNRCLALTGERYNDTHSNRSVGSASFYSTSKGAIMTTDRIVRWSRTKFRKWHGDTGKCFIWPRSVPANAAWFAALLSAAAVQLYIARMGIPEPVSAAVSDPNSASAVPRMAASIAMAASDTLQPNNHLALERGTQWP